MKTYILAIPAAEVIHLLRAEIEAAHGAPELDIGGAEKEYILEEDFDRRAYGIHDGEQFDLATSMATLTIEPCVEAGYWILELVIERALGPVRVSQEDDLTRRDLTLDEFEAELAAPGDQRVSVRLHVQASTVRQDFERWLAEIRERHPWEGQQRIQAPATTMQRARTDRLSGERQMNDIAQQADLVKEAVGVFRDPTALEAAVDALEVAGFDRAAISVLGTDGEASEQIGRFYQSVKQMEDSGRLPRDAFVERDSRTEGEAAAVAVPLYFGGLAGAAAVAAAEGALALSIAAAIVGGVVGAGLGAILAAAIAHHHAKRVKEQLDKGGLVLWVSVPTEDSQKRAVDVLTKMDAQDIHVHEIKREWNPSDIPATIAQPDPFLEKERF